MENIWKVGAASEKSWKIICTNLQSVTSKTGQSELFTNRKPNFMCHHPVMHRKVPLYSTNLLPKPVRSREKPLVLGFFSPPFSKIKKIQNGAFQDVDLWDIRLEVSAIQLQGQSRASTVPDFAFVFSKMEKEGFFSLEVLQIWILVACICGCFWVVDVQLFKRHEFYRVNLKGWTIHFPILKVISAVIVETFQSGAGGLTLCFCWCQTDFSYFPFSLFICWVWCLLLGHQTNLTVSNHITAHKHICCIICAFFFFFNFCFGSAKIRTN